MEATAQTDKTRHAITFAKNGSTHWVPDLPGRLRKRIELFTAHRDGFVRKHAGTTLFVIGKGKFLAALQAGGPTAAVELLESTWADRSEAADEAGQETFARLRASGGLQLVHLLSEFYEYVDARVSTGKPKRIEATTPWNGGNVETSIRKPRYREMRDLSQTSRILTPRGRTRRFHTWGLVRPLARRGKCCTQGPDVTPHGHVRDLQSMRRTPRRQPVTIDQDERSVGLASELASKVATMCSERRCHYTHRPGL